MTWRFTILNNRTSVATVIDEPVGFDADTAVIARDAAMHGILFSYQGESFEFYGTSMSIIKNEWDQYRYEGDLTLIMEEDCGDGYEEFDRAAFDFTNYDYFEGDSSYVKIPVESTGVTIQFSNRISQKVDLESLVAFDLVTPLAPYNKLAFELQLPSKGIFMQDMAVWKVEGETTASLSDVPLIQHDGNPSAINWGWFQIVPQFDDQTLTEFGSFTTDITPECEFIKSGFYPTTIDPTLELVVNGLFTPGPDTRRIYFDWTVASPLLVNDANTNNFDAVDSFSCDLDYSFSMSLINVNVCSLYNVLVIRRANGTYEYLDKVRIFSGLVGGGPGGFNSGTIWLKGSTNTVSFSASHSTVELHDGDYLFTVVCGLSFYANTDAEAGLDAFSMDSISGSVNLQALTHTTATFSKVFAINETISRIAESITNDKLRAYSEYFGRTDSQPYALPQDGCGSLEVITDGIRVRRQENLTPGVTNTFAVSVDDCFQSLSAIHNIGMGIEPDLNRPGFNRLRTEPWKYFYNETVVMRCIGIANIERKANAKEAFSTFQFGYSTWEAEEYNGLDELLTKRNYRTTLSTIKNDLVKLSAWIASGYALEVTRRKGNADTKDWRYDNNIFVICCKRGGTNSAIPYNARFFGLSINLDNTTVVPGWCVVGAQFNVTGASNAGNNRTFTIVSVGIAGTSLAIRTSPASVNNPTLQAIDILPLIDANQITVELGNVTNPTNIIDPATLYNYPISPLRNAMRWMNTVFESYAQFGANCKLLFTDGDGNYFASGEVATAGCRLENSVITENQIIDPSIYADVDEAKPLLLPERAIYDYPMSTKEYKALKQNPYGQIYFESNCDSGYGYIDNINYKMEEGLATFTLIPKAD